MQMMMGTPSSQDPSRFSSKVAFGKPRDVVRGLRPQAALVHGCCAVRWTDVAGKKLLRKLCFLDCEKW